MKIQAIDPMVNVVRLTARMSAFVVLICAFTVSAGCGQKGALYMPEEQQQTDTAPATDQTTQSESPSNEEVSGQ